MCDIARFNADYCRTDGEWQIFGGVEEGFQSVRIGFLVYWMLFVLG